MEHRRHELKPRDRPASQSVPFDYDRSLARLGGDPALFDEIVLLFLEDSPQLLEQARAGMSDNDLELLARSAHSLKNLSATFDAAELTHAAAAVEQHAHDGAMAQATACFEAMEQELARLQASLTKFAEAKSEH